MDDISIHQPTQVGWTGYSGTNYPAAGSCGNWSDTWCAGSGTYSYLSLTQGVNYTVENTAAATCGAALPTAYLQAWWAGGATSCGWGAIGTAAANSISFNAQITGDHIVNVSSGVGASNSCGSASQHDFTGRSAVLRYRQNTTVTNTTSTAAICQSGTKTLSATLGGTHNNPTIVWSVVSGGGSISGNTYTPSAAGTVVVRATVGGCSSDVSFVVNASTNNPGAISVPANICVGTATNISNTTAATGSPGAASYYFYYRGGPSDVGWTMYDGPTTNTSSALPAAVINTPGSWFVARNSDFGCGQANNATTLNIPITVNSAPTAGTLSNAGPVNFCDAGGNFTTALTVSGQNGTVWWDWGSNNGVWNNNWLTGGSSGVSIFPKKTSGSDGNADRIRYRVTQPGCADVTSSTILIVNKFNEPPSSLASSSTALCSTTGGNITLTATFPASINKNGTVAFYSGSCGGTFVGSVTAGDNTSSAAITIPAPTSTTTYYARYEPGTGSSCSNTACVAVTVNVSAASVAPTSVSGSGVTVCHGNTVTLTASGGSLSAGASYQWFTGSCGGTAAGTGASITVTPTATTTYYVRAGAGTSCPATTCASGTVTLPTAGTGLATSGQSATCNVSGSNWIHFYHSSGNLIASINPNGNNLGSVTATAYVSGGAQLTQACGTGSNPSYTTAALGRSWLITPTNNLAASVRFPFAAAELTSLVTASAGTSANLLDNVSGIGDLKMSHYSGPNNLNGSWSDNCVSAGGSGGTQLVGAQAGNGLVTTAAGFPATVASTSYVQFNTPGFSEFWLHGDGGSSPLPVELTGFSANCNESGDVELFWTTASEHNSQKFVIERSRDLHQWSTAGENAAAGNSSYTISYDATDKNALGGVSYYRLIQVDNDGAERIYGPVSVSCSESRNGMTVFPNPTKGTFTVEVTSEEYMGESAVQLTDLTGKVIAVREAMIYEGRNQLLFETLDLKPGTYIVRMMTGTGFHPVRIVVSQ